jgi:hypothetical protein
LARLEVGEVSIYQQSGPIAIQLPQLDRVSQHQGRLERSYFKAMRELERLQNARRAPKADHPEQVAPPLQAVPSTGRTLPAATSPSVPRAPEHHANFAYAEGAAAIQLDTKPPLAGDKAIRAA